MVNSFRAALQPDARRHRPRAVPRRAVGGSKVYTYIPGQIVARRHQRVQRRHRRLGQTVRGPASPTRSATTSRWCAAVIRFGVGANLSYWDVRPVDQRRARSATSRSTAAAPACRSPTSSADSCSGSSTARPGILPLDQTYIGFYAQDSWRAARPRDRERRHAVGAVLRAEHPERRDLELQPRELPQGREEHGVHATRRPA